MTMNPPTKKKIEVREYRKAKTRSIKMIRDLEKNLKAVFDPKIEDRIRQRLDFLEHIEGVLIRLGDRTKKFRLKSK